MRNLKICLAYSLLFISLFFIPSFILAQPPSLEELRDLLHSHKSAIIQLNKKLTDEHIVTDKNNIKWAITWVKFYKEDPSTIIDNLKNVNNTEYTFIYDTPIDFHGNRFNYTEKQFQEALANATEITARAYKEIKNIPQIVLEMILKMINKNEEGLI